MKRIWALVFLALGLPLQASTLWSAGVTRDAGWFDANKSHQRGAEGDDLMCWAVVASNLVAWWQQQNSALVPAGTPAGDAVWLTYLKSFDNEGSDPDQGLRWWFSGQYEQRQPGGGLKCAALKQTASGGYYRQSAVVLENWFYNGRGAGVTARHLTEVLYRGFARGDAFWMGASCRKPDGSRFMHSITVWGVDYEMNADGAPCITAIYMCDSDDRVRCLHRIPVRVHEEKLVFDCAQHPMYGRLGLVTLDVYGGLRSAAPQADSR